MQDRFTEEFDYLVTELAHDMRLEVSPGSVCGSR